MVESVNLGGIFFLEAEPPAGLDVWYDESLLRGVTPILLNERLLEDDSPENISKSFKEKKGSYDLYNICSCHVTIR